MPETDRHAEQLYQLQSVLRGISPLMGRRLLVRSDTTVAQLHEVFQIAFGWDDEGDRTTKRPATGKAFQIDADAGSFLVREGGAMRSCP